MSLYESKQITVFTGSTLGVHLLDKRESNHLQAIHEARDITSSTLAPLKLFQLNDGRVLEKRLYHDRDYLFDSLPNYEEIKGNLSKGYESGSLLYNNNYDLLYSCHVDSSYLAKLIRTNSLALTKELSTSNYDLYQISKQTGLFYILKDRSYSSAMWFSDLASFEYYHKLFTM